MSGTVAEATATPSPNAVDQIMEAALKPSREDRAELLERLDENFEEDQWGPEERAALLAELDRRLAAHRRNPSSTIDAEEVFRKPGLEDELLS